MNYRLQLSPTSGTRETGPAVHVSRLTHNHPASLENAKFLRSWLVYDSSLESKGRRVGINWNTVFGLAFAIAVSVGCWIGAGFAIARLVR